jgi:hypothetical protein
MTTIRDHFELGMPSDVSRFKPREFITGVEYEIEAIKGFGNLQEQMCLAIVEDNSLRNNGREIKTSPMTYEEQLGWFKTIHSQLNLGKDPFSDRTSIHVHVNVRDLTLPEVRQLILCYALLEPLFFEFVGPVRKGSIFCVPLNYTYIPSLYNKPVQGLIEKWHKYTAFNILPMSSFGTVEFRHMYGTGDFELFRHWLTAIRELYTFIESSKDFDLIKALEKGLSTYDLAISIVPILANLHSKANIIELLNDTLLDVKLSVGGLKG